jgi:uncharacterized protein YjbI with pentapeptide repeats
MSAVVAVVTAVVALVGAILGLFKYFDLRSKRQAKEAIGSAFKGIVATLAGTDRVERLGSAILLRRFFMADSEYSKPDMPYADEAVDVIAATLRGEPVGDVQKVLADSLAYVGKRGLSHRDFQHVNLQHGYISLTGPAGHVVRSAEKRPRRLVRRRAGAAPPADGENDPEVEQELRLDLSDADFYEANVAGASFRKDICKGTIFYQATAVEAVFAGADLTGADFRQADLTGADFRKADLRRAKFAGATLKGADFSEAKLAGARFKGAHQVPEEITHCLDEGGTYGTKDAEPGRPVTVFVSAPSIVRPSDGGIVEAACACLREHGYEPVRVSPDAYRDDRHLFDVRETMAGCAGVVVLGLPQLELQLGKWRPATADERTLADAVLPTPWNDIETGIGVGLGIPVLSIRAGCGPYGVFALSSQASGFEQAELSEPWSAASVAEVVQSWAQRAFPSGQEAQQARATS